MSNSEVQTPGNAEANWAETENLLDSAEDLIEAIREEHRQGEGLARQRKLVEELRAELQGLVGAPVSASEGQAASGGTKVLAAARPGKTTAIWISNGRRRLSLTQQQLAKKSGCSGAMIGAIETGRARPSPGLLARIQKALGVAAGS
ncbi:MAG TPA: helix-turn-helix transcriptional regulator [Candidatus Saccharimonadales bacterium]|nr:helix-turn-helix transcriptional regulator [Candidatus Saccharimonadales bacterium]